MILQSPPVRATPGSCGRPGAGAARSGPPRPTGCAAQGLVEGAEPRLTGTGRELLGRIEAETDRLAEPAYQVLGEDGCARLAELTRPLSRTMVKAGMLDPARIVNPRT